jgi:flagellar protein FliO/FliZ
MNNEDYIRLIAALVFVLALMGGLWIILRKLGLSGPQRPSGRRRLRIIESIPLDSRRRALILQRDNTQHLVILGPTGETVVETQIPVPADEHIEAI